MAAPARQRHWLQPKNWSLSTHEPRFEAIRPWVEGRDVLDVGCATGWHRPDWLHGLIREVASSAVGVDLDAERVASANDRHGTSIEVADATKLSGDRTFDVIHAGELIEHLVDFRGFLDGIRPLLREGGRLILTTPNVFSISTMAYRLGISTPRVNEDHTCWFDSITIAQMLAKVGYTVESTAYIRHRTPGRWRSMLTTAVRSPLPDRLAWNTLMVVATPSPPSTPAL